MKMSDLMSKLSSCYTGVVHDIMREMGFQNFTLPKEITPLVEGEVLCGPIFTIEGKVDENADAHQTLLEWTGLLSKAKSGHIWVCQPNDLNVAFMGELSAETLLKKGVLGCVIDGGIRDTSFITDINFPTWRRFHTPRDIVGYWLPTKFNKPIVIGNVTLNAGDYLLGDRDGIICIPKNNVEEITEKSIVAIKTESKVRTAILSGIDPREAYLKFDKF